MLYESTRGGESGVRFLDAIKMGIPCDGGLFVPSFVASFSENEIKNMCDFNYQDRAKAVLKLFIDDLSDEEIEYCINRAYTDEKFDNPNIAPVVKLNEQVSVLELWHGPTCAFKDMALQILPHLLTKACEKTLENYEIVILVATSGDTGKAALEGFKNVAGTKIIVFYPKDGVSFVQKLQMTTQEGSNVHCIAVCGNFDDTQNGVKKMFADATLQKKLLKSGFKFSSANSINWGRLVPQIVYYFSAYADVCNNGSIQFGQQVNFLVPTGNFGNILAGYYAKQIGLPINKLICASNENNVLTDFINSGEYNKNRNLINTLSPSMDILISSNLERLLYEITNHDENLLKSWMESLNVEGYYTIGEEISKRIKGLFFANYSKEKEVLKTIEDTYKNYNYIVDPHTAVGINVYDKYVLETQDITHTIILSTASPFKFNDTVARSIFGEELTKDKSEIELISYLSNNFGIKMPDGLKDLDKKEQLHYNICEKEDMLSNIERILGLIES